MKTKILLFSFVLCSFFNAKVFAFVLGKKDSESILTIARVDKNYPPLEYIDKKNNLVGSHIDILHKKALNLGYKIKVVQFPFMRGLKALEDGEVDGMLFLQKNPDREKFAYFFDGNILSVGGFSFITYKGSKIKFNGNLQQFFRSTPKIGVVRGYARPQVLEEFKSNFEESVDDETLIKKLLGKRYKAAVVTSSSIETLLKNYDGNKNVEVLNPPIASFNIFLAFSKKLKNSLNEQEKAKKIAQQFSDVHE